MGKGLGLLLGGGAGVGHGREVEDYDVGAFFVDLEVVAAGYHVVKRA